MKSDSMIISYENIDFEIHYDYYPEEKPNLDPESPTCGPGSEEAVDISEISIISDTEKNDLYDLLPESTITYMKEMILDQIGEE